MQKNRVRGRYRRMVLGTVILLGLQVRLIAETPATIDTLFETGPSSRRIDLVFISEGYTESELPLFRLQAAYVKDFLFSSEPFKEYQNYFNAFAVSVASAESGSDHPSLGIFKDTFFNSSYDSYGLAHALTIPPNDRDPDIENGYGKAYRLLEELLPDWDLLVFIVNDSAFGGWGDARGVICSADYFFGEVIAHELGHTLAGLGDEYSDAFPDDPEPVREEPNTTQETRREFIKWKAWIEDGTPIPTPTSTLYRDRVGLFEGARYQAKGWYRPKFRCRMNSWIHPFCEVCTEALVKSFCSRTGTVDSFSPQERRLELLSTPLRLSVAPMSPATHSVETSWYIDGHPVAGPDVSQLELEISRAGLGPGTHEVRVEVSDPSVMVRNDPERLLKQEVVWEIQVSDTALESIFPNSATTTPGFTGFAILNLSEQETALTFSATGEDGENVAHGTNPRHLMLGPRHQLARLSSEIYESELNEQERSWVRLTSSQPVSGLFLIGDGTSHLDGAAGVTRSSSTLYFTELMSDAPAESVIRRFCILNPHSDPVLVWLRLREHSGRSLAETALDLGAHNMTYFELAELFGKTSLEPGAYLEAEVTSGQGAIGFEWIHLPQAKTSIVLNSNSPTFATRLFSAQLACGEVGGRSVFTRLNLVNTMGIERTVTVKAYSESGVPIDSPHEFKLGPKESREIDMGELLNASVAAVQGSLAVEADGPGVVGSVLFGEPGSMRYAAALPLQTTPFLRAVFNQVANGMGLFTGLAVFNPEDQETSVQIEVFSSEGKRTGSTDLLIGPRQKIARLLPELVEESREQVRGYVVIRSTSPVVAQQLFGDSSLNFLTAVVPGILE